MTKLKRGIYLIVGLLELAIVAEYFWQRPEYYHHFQTLTWLEYVMIVGYLVIALNALVLLLAAIFRRGVTNQLIIESHFGNQLSIDRSAVQASIEKTLIHEFDAINPRVTVTLVKRKRRARVKIKAQLAAEQELSQVVESMKAAVKTNVEQTLGIPVGKLKIHLQPISRRDKIKVR